VLERSPDFTALQNTAGDTLLHAAAVGGSVDCVLVLLLHGMDPQTPNLDAQTALHLTCGGCADSAHAAAIVFLLLKYVALASLV
jgi:ankyrin repeat protein